MHSGIALAVQADDAEDAVARAERFNEYSAHWSDWSEHGGRWSDVVEGSVLRYSDNPEKFRSIVENFQNSTQSETKRLMELVGDLSIKELVTDPKYRFSTGMGNLGLRLWQANKLLSITQGTFCPEQHFYDTEEYTEQTKYMDERIAKDPDKQFIVIWDYHH